MGSIPVAGAKKSTLSQSAFFLYVRFADIRVISKDRVNEIGLTPETKEKLIEIAKEYGYEREHTEKELRWITEKSGRLLASQPEQFRLWMAENGRPFAGVERSVRESSQGGGVSPGDRPTGTGEEGERASPKSRKQINVPDAPDPGFEKMRMENRETVEKRAERILKKKTTGFLFTALMLKKKES